MNRRIERFANAPELQHAAAVSIVRFLNEAIIARGVASIALSGGSTPKAIYELLGAEPLRSQLDWKTVHVFFGDERCVPQTHANSNYRMTSETLLHKISIPQENVHRIQAERSPNEAAKLYSEEIRKFFGSQENELPRFDVMLLGVGEDGHTASLFPETKILDDTKRFVAEVFVSKFNAYRISVTLPVINNSRVIMFLVSGASKARILRDVLEGEPNRYPAQRVQPTDGVLYWLVDEPAASHLQNV